MRYGSRFLSGLLLGTLLGLLIGMSLASLMDWRIFDRLAVHPAAVTGGSQAQTSGQTPGLAIDMPIETKPASSQGVKTAPTNDAFRVQMDQGILLLGQAQFEQAFAKFLSASYQVQDYSEQNEFERWLAQLVDEYSRALVAVNQFDRLDRFFEQLTLALPQLAEYQLQLGKLRIRMGNSEAALQPLAQVTNHEKLGAQARQLIAQIEQAEATHIALEELPLTIVSGQYIVEAILDGRISLKLLIDTGAAITAIDGNTLKRAGYDLSGERQYFVTANGVVDAPVVTAKSFALGEAARSDLTIGALELALPPHVDGLLGMNFLRHYEFRIDQNNQLLILDER